MSDGTEGRDVATPTYNGIERDTTTRRDHALGRALYIALQALSIESAQWAALLLSFVLFGAAVWWPETKRIAAACLFTALVHIPLWLRKDRR